MNLTKYELRVSTRKKKKPNDDFDVILKKLEQDSCP
jgi:hypothetical protein